MFRGRGSHPDPSNKDYIASFYARLETSEEAWKSKAITINHFVHRLKTTADQIRCAFVTSGSVGTALDKARVNTIETIGSGNRGAGCAEAFLQAGYHVLYLYRQGSLRPFSRWLTKRVRKTEQILDHLHLDEASGRVELQLDSKELDRVKTNLESFQTHRSRLLEVSFVDLEEYLYLLRLTCRAINALEDQALLFLAAGLTKRYIPHNELRPPSASPLDEKEGPLKLMPVPHVLRMARTLWCPKAYICAFKLQDNPILLAEDAHRQLEQLGVHLVIGNVVAKRESEVLVVTEREETRLILNQQEEDVDLESSMVLTVTRHHLQYRLEREALAQSKSLLNLSAKFCMYREDMNTVNEDAEGHKDVPFRVGLRLRSRRGQPDSPIWELKSVYNNEQGSARAHLWQKVGPQPLHGPGEVILSFSPAGTPDTILHIFGDAWKGWLEDEIKSLAGSVRRVPISEHILSLIKLLTAPVTGDFGEAATLLDAFGKHVKIAWEERERTQFVSAMSNLMALGFDRSLTSVEGLFDTIVLPGPAPEAPPEPLPPAFPGGDVSPSLPAHPELGLESSVSVHEQKLQKRVFRGRSMELELSGAGQLRCRAQSVKVHNTVKRYADEMMRMGLLKDAIDYAERDRNCKFYLTGYSLGGMMSQYFSLRLGEAMQSEGLSTERVTMIAFGSPRVGDEGFKSRLKLLYPNPVRLINVIYPLDVIHAFPPVSEGYVDACLKIFLRRPGQFTSRRRASLLRFATPLTWLRVLDTHIDHSRQHYKVQREKEKATVAVTRQSSRHSNGGRLSTDVCGFCKSDEHSTERHRCSVCTERGAHRGADCPNREAGCKLCGKSDHPTGHHTCSVCRLVGHRGRDCHSMADVGWAELVSYAAFHDYVYYSMSAAAQEEVEKGGEAELDEPLPPSAPSSPDEVSTAPTSVDR